MSLLDGFFDFLAIGTRKTPVQRIRADQRDLSKNLRQLESQIAKINRELVSDRAKVAASLRAQQTKEAEFRTRHMLQLSDQRDHLYVLRNQLSLFTQQLGGIESDIRLGECMRKITLAMIRANQLISPQNAEHISMRFEQARGLHEMKQEILAETFSRMTEETDSPMDDGQTMDRRQAALLEAIAEENGLSLLEQTSRTAVPVLSLGRAPVAASTRVLDAPLGADSAYHGARGPEPPASGTPAGDELQQLEQRLFALRLPRPPADGPDDEQ